VYLFCIASPTCLVAVYFSLSITSPHACSASGGIPYLDITEHVQYITLPLLVSPGQNKDNSKCE